MANDLRFERKFLVSGFSNCQMEHCLKLHPAQFSSIFTPRIVNNIYFDTLGLNHYFDNVDGEKSRLKVRIRWYGDMFAQINKPVLEYKIKSGLLGRKVSHGLNPFELDKTFNKNVVANAVERQEIPENVRAELLSLQPMLLNQYSRSYFLSADKKIRITIDSNLTYFRINYFGNTFLNKSIDHNTFVLEMKYSPDMDEEARNISNFFPFPLTKSSKYLQGLERIFI